MTQSEVLAGIVSAELCHIVRETSPPDYVKKISRFIESSVDNSKPDAVLFDHAEAEGDSDDSLFITQKPVPPPVRSRRRHRLNHSIRATGEECEGESSASSSDEEGGKKGRKKQCRPSDYTFPFLFGRKSRGGSTQLPVHQNQSLHNFAMAGFFKCVRELWQDNMRREDVLSSLPRIDMEGIHISPLSEKEEEGSEDEDFKVVKRTCLLLSSKAKKKKMPSGLKRLKQQKEVRKAVRPQERRLMRSTTATSRVTPSPLVRESTDQRETPETATSLVIASSDNRQASGAVLAQPPERPLPPGDPISSQQKASEADPHTDSDATWCDSQEIEMGLRQFSRDGEEAATATENPSVCLTEDPSQEGQTEDEPQTPGLHMNELNTEGPKVKKKRKKKTDRHHESVEEETGQGQEEPEGVQVEVEETPGPSEDQQAEPSASQTQDEQERRERDCMESSSHDDTIVRQEESHGSDSKRKKKTQNKRKKSGGENSGQEVDGNLELEARVEDSVLSSSCITENGEKEEKKKKKKKRRGKKISDVGVEHVQSAADAQPDDAGIKVKKKKRKKEEESVSTVLLEEAGSGFENAAESQETSEPGGVKRTKQKKKTKQKSSNDAAQGGEEGGEEGGEASFANEAEPLSDGAGQPLKKKKKKRISHVPEENATAEDVERSPKPSEDLKDQSAALVTKKKKKKKSETCSRGEVTVPQTDDSASERKKGKRRASSFLVADSEGKACQTAGEQKTPSPSAQAEQTPVAAGDMEAEPAETTAEPVGRKKKKKKKAKVSVDHDDGVKDQQGCEEPNKISQSALQEATGSRAKRKKKRVRNGSVETLERPADSGPAEEDVGLRKGKCSDGLSHAAEQQPPFELLQYLQLSVTPEKEAGCELSGDESPGGRASRGRAAKRQRNTSAGSRRQQHAGDGTPSSPTLPENGVPSSGMKKKKKNVKRRLLNPPED